MTLGMRLENGWPECDPSDCETLTIPNTPLRLLIREGQPHAILQAFFRDVDAFIEPVMNARGIADEGSWTEDNSVYTSNHKGATAVDWNWTDHAFRIADAGWDGSVLINGSQIPAMRELLAWYEGMVFWGNDWDNPKDSMHFQMGYNTFGAENVARVQSFIDRKIRADGYSTFRRGGVPRGGGSAVTPSAPANPIPVITGLTAEVLWDIAARPSRVSVARYAELLPRLVECQEACGCTTIDRRAMWYAQVFHESGGLFYTEEIASGDAYDTRTDLGNTPQVDGDGRLYKGRSFIQVTGKNNYAKMSGWAFEHGYVPTRDWFVVHPETLDDDEFAFLGVTWYWTTQRPMNDAADARNLELATRYVNGGTNGLDGPDPMTRRNIYNRALAHNAELTPIISLDPWEALMADNTPDQSRSIYRSDDAKFLTARDAVYNIDGMAHGALVVEPAALRGETWAVQAVAALAAGTAPGAHLWWDHSKPDTWAIDRAKAILAAVPTEAKERVLAARKVG